MTELRKSLGVMRGTAMMLNIVLGAGLLTLPGLALQQTGDWAIFVWVACAVAAAPLLWVFAVLGQRYPDAGGVAAIMGHAFGKWGRASATLLFLGAVLVGLPAIALTGGHYAATVLGGPSWTYATGLIIAALAVNFLSTEIAGRVNALMASLVLIFIICIAVVGWFVVPENTSVRIVDPISHPGMQQLGLTFMMVFFAFTGWEVSANLSGEFRNPQRDLPRAMALSFAVAVALYLVLALIVAKAGATGSGPAPFARIFGDAFGWTGSATIAITAVLLIFANLSAAIWAVSRMVFSAAREGFLPSQIGKIRGDVPLNAVVMTVLALVIVVFLVGMNLLDLSQILAAAGQNFLLLYAGGAASLLCLEKRVAYSALSLFSLALVVTLLISRLGEGLAYPAILVSISLIMVYYSTRKANPSHR